MIKNKSDLNDEFLKNFPKIYQNPSSTNSYLAENTSQIEEKILNHFKQYELELLSVGGYRPSKAAERVRVVVLNRALHPLLIRYQHDLVQRKPWLIETAPTPAGGE